ncbi:MAG: glycosyltransferase [Hamadaea sp.]|nr:glycosyltransferase [Hamadaea sp.]NUT03700.1 glycosyltransferase [Hamadaea sp.]
MPVRTRTSRDSLSARRHYTGTATAAGPLQPAADGQAVRMRPVASRRERIMLTLLVLLNAATGGLLITWLIQPQHLPGYTGGLPEPALWVARVGFVLVIAVELVRLAQNVAVWVYAFHAKDPVPVDPPIGWRVALLTTIVPGKEPVDLVERTLRKMLQIAYCGTVEVWILDEGDDPEVKAMAARLGVRHFTRRGRPEYNQPDGPFRAKSKAGNHNAWRAEHEHDYDVVAQMDPDHVPLPCFLERTLGYFRDPDVAFVVAPQVYGNMYDNWIAHGASVQQYLFSGIVERGGNGLDAPLLIGTNHLYRPAAWAAIGGYQDSIIEDHLTSMRVQGQANPLTGHRWKGVYTPDVLAVGEGPTSWADYFNQQKRWSYGIWEILLRRRDARRGLSWRQRLLYGCVQFYYPSVAVALLLGTLATALYLLFGVASIELHNLTWLALWSASLGTWFLLWFWLRRFNLAEHERVEAGMPGMALALFAGPIYLAAATAALLRRPLGYAVTAKGDLTSSETPKTFRLHLWWAAVTGALLAASILLGHDYLALRVWAGLSVLAGLGPPLIALGSEIAHRVTGRASVAPAQTVRAKAPATWIVRYAGDGSPPAGQVWRGRETGRWHDRFVVDGDGGAVRHSAYLPGEGDRSMKSGMARAHGRSTP